MKLKVGLLLSLFIVELFLLKESQCEGVIFKKPIPGWPKQQQMFRRDPVPPRPRYQDDSDMSKSNPSSVGRQENLPSNGHAAFNPQLVTRRFIRRDISPQTQFQGGQQGQGQGQAEQARFFSWLFGYGGRPYYPPVPDHGPEYCVEYFDPLTGFSTEDCTPLY